MDQDTVRYWSGVVLAGGVVAGALSLAGYLLFTDVTTLPGSSDPATGLEAGNAVLVALATLPVLLAGIGLLGAYRRRWLATTIPAVPLLVVGISGFSLGFGYVALGCGLLVCGPLVAKHPGYAPVSAGETT